MTLILALLSHSWHSTWTTSCLSSSSNPSQWKSSSTNSSTMSAAVVIKSMIILMIAAKILEVKKNCQKIFLFTFWKIFHVQAAPVGYDENEFMNVVEQIRKVSASIGQTKVIFFANIFALLFNANIFRLMFTISWSPQCRSPADWRSVGEFWENCFRSETSSDSSSGEDDISVWSEIFF